MCLKYFWTLTLYGHIKTAQQLDRYTAIWWFVHWPLMGRLLHLVQPTILACGPAQSPSRCTKCNSPPVNGQCTNFTLFHVSKLLAAVVLTSILYWCSGACGDLPVLHLLRLRSLSQLIQAMWTCRHVAGLPASRWGGGETLWASPSLSTTSSSASPSACVPSPVCAVRSVQGLWWGTALCNDKLTESFLLYLPRSVLQCGKDLLKFSMIAGYPWRTVEAPRR